MIVKIRRILTFQAYELDHTRGSEPSHAWSMADRQYKMGMRIQPIDNALQHIFASDGRSWLAGVKSETVMSTLVRTLKLEPNAFLQEMQKRIRQSCCVRAHSFLITPAVDCANKPE